VKPMPKVSVVVTCYNDGQYLDEALCSVANQTLPAMEIILVDDASDDFLTIKYLEELPKAGFDHLTIVRLAKNSGVSFARNKGIEIAQGDYIVPLDGDDRLLREFLARTVPILEDNPECGGVGTWARFFGALEGDVQTPPYRFPDILFRPLLFSVGVFRKTDWKAAGGYKELMREAWEDYEFWISLLGLGKKLVQVPEVLFEYRQKTVDQSRNSWVSNIERRVILHSRIFRLHPKLYGENAEELFRRLVLNEELQEAQAVLAPLSSIPEIWLGGRAFHPDREFVFGEIEEVRFDIPEGALAGLKELRFDPTECPGSLYVSSVEFWRRGVCTVRWLEKHLVESLKVGGTLIPDDDYGEDSCRFFSIGIDPQLLLQLPDEFPVPDQIRVKMSFTCSMLSTIDALQRNAAFLGNVRRMIATAQREQEVDSRISHVLVWDWSNLRKTLESDLALERGRRRRIESLKGANLIKAFDRWVVGFWRLWFFCGFGGRMRDLSAPGKIRFGRSKSGIVEWTLCAQGLYIRLSAKADEVWLEGRTERFFFKQDFDDGYIFAIGGVPFGGFLVRGSIMGRVKTLGFFRNEKNVG